MVISTITMCGLTNGISRYFYYTDKEGVNRDEVVWSAVTFITIFTLIVVSILFYFSEAISQLLFDTPQYFYLVKLTLLNIFMSNIAGAGRSILIFEEKVWTVNAISLCGIVIGVISGLTMVVYFKRGVIGSVEAALISSTFMTVFTSLLSIKKYSFNFNYGILKKQIRFSLPLMFAVFAFFFIDSSDRYLLKIFLPVSEIGLYSIGYQLGLVMMLFVGGFSSAWPPYYHKNNQNNEGQSICNQALTMYMLPAAFFAVLISIASQFILRVLTTDAFHSAYTVVPFVALAYMLKGPYLIFLIGIAIKNKTSWQLYLEAIAAALNIVLNILLIPIIGREAAAMTTLLSYSILVIGSYIMVSRINPIPGSLYKPMLTIGISTLVCLFTLLPFFSTKYFIWAPLLFLTFTISIFILFKREIVLIKNSIALSNK